MLYKLIFLFLLPSLTETLKAQESELLTGTWIFKDVYNKEKIDEEGLSFLKAQIVNKLTFTFKKDGTFSSYMMGENLSGTWSKKRKSNKILLSTKDGDYELRILELTKDKLALKVGAGEFWMAKSRKK